MIPFPFIWSFTVGMESERPLFSGKAHKLHIDNHGFTSSPPPTEDYQLADNVKDLILSS